MNPLKNAVLTDSDLAQVIGGDNFFDFGPPPPPKPFDPLDPDLWDTPNDPYNVSANF